MAIMEMETTWITPNHKRNSEFGTTQLGNKAPTLENA